MNQHHVHRYVLEHITGVPAALKFSNRLAGIGATAASVAALFIIVTTLVTNRNFEGNMQLALAFLLSGFPFAVLAQRYTIRAVLERKNLRLTRFLIGKKEYAVPRNRVLTHDLDMFAAAANAVCNAPALEPARHAAAWHTYRVFEETPGVAVSIGWFGSGGEPYAFLYGDHKVLATEASEIWDLGHIRKKSEADTLRFETAGKNWRQTAGIPVAIAYAPLPATTNPDTLNMADIKNTITLLGLLNVQSAREPGITFTPQPAQSIRTAARISFVTTIAMGILLAISFAGGLAGLVTPPYLLHIGLLAVLLLPVLTSSLSWDQFKAKGRPATFTKLLPGMLFAACAVGVITCLQYAWYLERYTGTLRTPAGSTFHQGAMALAFGTLAGCLIIEAVLQRGGSTWWHLNKWNNPFFLLSAASAVLLLTIGMYTTGPIISTDLWYLAGGSLLYLALRSVALHAETHHSRDHILALLNQR